MGFQTASFLTEGVWASLTGGWYYDKKQSHFSNLFHLYIWLIFLCVPFVNYLFVNTYLSWLVYCIFIGLVFIIIKLTNAYFHRIFDTGKCFKEEAGSPEEAAQNSLDCHDGDSSKDQFEMVVMPNSRDAEGKDEAKNMPTVVSNTEKVDVCNDDKKSNSSYANLSLLFGSNSSDEATPAAEEENSKVKAEQPVNSEHMSKSVSNKSSLDLVSNSDTSLSNMITIYTKANSSHNSIGVIDNVNYEMSTFRRARSELETMKHSRPTLLVPPSHPVSMEIINAKNSKVNEETKPLDMSRFQNEPSNRQHPFESILDGRFGKGQINLPQTSKDSLDDIGSNLEKIEEAQERNVSANSASYVKIAQVDSDDGDESEVSLCGATTIVNEPSKPRAVPIRKWSKQPARKCRFGSNRKRCSTGQFIRQREMPKSQFVLLSTSDEEEALTESRLPSCSFNTRMDGASSDSSSFIPSSSSSDASVNKTQEYEMLPLHIPSTSTGISRVHHKKSYSGVIYAKNRQESDKEWNRLKQGPQSVRTGEIDWHYKRKGPAPTDWRQQHKRCPTQLPPSFEAELERLSAKKSGKKEVDIDWRPKKGANFQTYIYNRQYDIDDDGPNSSLTESADREILAEMIAPPGTHLATSHEDTTIGAVHVFQDEHGHWFSYTFDENSTGVAKGICPLSSVSGKYGEGEKHKSRTMASSDSIFYLNNCLPSADLNSILIHNSHPQCHAHALTDPGKELFKSELMQSFVHSMQSDNPAVTARNLNFLEGLSVPTSYILEVSTASEVFHSLKNLSLNRSLQQQQQQLKQYYQMNILNLKTIKIRFDRLALQAFLDRNRTNTELIFTIVLAIMVAIFSSILLYKNFFHDLSLILFCLVVASSQYTLLKSVQPDAASPTHGFNHITIYGRPLYFCMGSLVLLYCNEYLTNKQRAELVLEIYNINLFNRDLIHTLFVLSRMFLLSFPLLFTFGFLPQFNTFVMYVFEQIDIHIFGGSASTMGMISATYALARSVFAVILLYLFGQALNIQETQRASFSVFCGLLIAISYHLSRLPSDPSQYWNVLISGVSHIGRLFRRLISNSQATNQTDLEREPLKQNPLDVQNDPLPAKLRNITLSRLESDLITCIFIAISVFGVHVSSIFKQPFITHGTIMVAIYWGLFLHYVSRHCRKQLPWLCFSNPILQTNEYKKFEVKEPAKIMWFERFQAWAWIIEKNLILPLVFLSLITNDCPLLIKNYGPNYGFFLLVLCSFKCIRGTFNNPSDNYIIIVFTQLFFMHDFKQINGNKDNIFLLNYFFTSIIFYKVTEFLLKLRFVVTYVAPWQITWGSAFHAFAQPFSVPHSAMLLVQIFVSSVLSSPLQPLLGSAIFLASYVRPIKFWERDYNTKRVDHSNTRLASQIDKTQIGADDNNLNSIFYEHLTRSLQHSLYGDLILGRWGEVNQGDCFVLASDNLNCLVHIIELGNGLVTFQVRGLEFRGTYCQQREVEAISESVSENDACCCCEPGHFRGMLSLNAAFNQRWLSWEVTHANYVLEGYSIAENSASTILQPYDMRKALVTYYVKAICYYCITYKNFTKWLDSQELKQSLSYLCDEDFVDLDPTFNYNIDEDYDILAAGVTRLNFVSVYKQWIVYCIEQSIDSSMLDNVRKHEEFVVSLCLGLSLLARRALGSAAHHNSALISVDFFLYGFHALFKGDFRVHCVRDEWVFQDMDFLNKVIAPAVRMSLKLHQDQFTTFEEYENNQILFDAISYYQKSLVISHEADPSWRNAILSNVPSLLALRHVFDDGTDQYKVIMLNKRYLSFRVIKINRECVRGLWAGQQQELIFLRNRNPERGSIQNAKQVLRNIINSSCDQPIGYPIYVSPLTTSFAETSEPLRQVIGPPLSLAMFKQAICGFFQKIRNRCSEVCSTSRSNDLTFSNARLSKSESSDRGIEDNVCSKGSLPSHTQLSNYGHLYRKKRVISQDARTDEPEMPMQSSTLVNLSSNRNLIALQFNAINIPESSTIPSTTVTATTTSSSRSVGTISTETSFINSTEQAKSVIMEKGSQHKGEPV